MNAPAIRRAGFIQGGVAMLLVAALLAGCGSDANGDDDEDGDAGQRDAATGDRQSDGQPAPDGGAGDGPGGDGGPSWWVPPVGTTWQWQLDTPVDQTVAAQLFDIDLFDNDASVVSALHTKGAKVICYISVGSWEDWRDDAASFPSAVLGNDYEGWAGEKWLDIRRIDLLGPIMGARFDQCQQKGFDGIEPDNIDSYQNDTGFPLTAADQIAYNTWLATEAHARGLSIGLKNDSDQVTELLPHFDWALTEDCFDQGWCNQLGPFVADGKAVFMAEYTDTGVVLADVCAEAQQRQFSAILKDRDLTAWRQTCP
jgi:hypothetical protein